MPIRTAKVYDNLPDRLNPGVNPYVTKLIEGTKSGSLPVAYGEVLEGLKGQWRKKLGLGDESILVVEIGCHYGQVLNEMALEHPLAGFIGLDITFKRVIKTALRAQRMQNDNLFSILANGRALADVFAKGEVDLFVIFFPDPFVKKVKQQQHRLIDTGFCKQVMNCLSEQGQVWFKTDCKPYFHSASDAFKATSFVKGERVFALKSQSYTSKFQQVFESQGILTQEAIWQRG